MNFINLSFLQYNYSMSNTEPIKYLSIVNNVIDLYQNELFKFIKKITI